MLINTQNINLFFIAFLLVFAACKTPTLDSKKESKETTKEETLAALEYYGDKIHFAKGSLESVKKHSSKLDKPIFLDFYTDWCQPCKWMEDDVFSLDYVAEFFNLNFINYKVNCEVDDGIMTGIDYKIITYPTFIFVDSEGKELIRMEGMFAGSVLINKGKEAIEKFENPPLPVITD